MLCRRREPLHLPHAVVSTGNMLPPSTHFRPLRSLLLTGRLAQASSFDKIPLFACLLPSLNLFIFLPVAVIIVSSYASVFCNCLINASPLSPPPCFIIFIDDDGGACEEERAGKLRNAGSTQASCQTLLLLHSSLPHLARGMEPVFEHCSVTPKHPGSLTCRISFLIVSQHIFLCIRGQTPVDQGLDQLLLSTVPTAVSLVPGAQ